MKILFYLHHPAHFHLFKHSIRKLIALKHDIRIVATKKDVLEDLIKTEGWEYENFLPHGRKDNKFSIAFGLIKQDLRLMSVKPVNHIKQLHTEAITNWRTCTQMFFQPTKILSENILILMKNISFYALQN